jgi:hypothetical protein
MDTSLDFDSKIWKDKYGQSFQPLFLADAEDHFSSTFILGHTTILLLEKSLVCLLKAKYYLPLHSKSNDQHEIIHKYWVLKTLINFSHHCLLQLEIVVTYYQEALQKDEENKYLPRPEKTLIALWKHEEVKRRLGMSLQHLECIISAHFEEQGPASNFNSVQLSFHLTIIHKCLLPLAQATVQFIPFSNVKYRVRSCLHMSEGQLLCFWNLEKNLIRDPISLRSYFKIAP